MKIKGGGAEKNICCATEYEFGISYNCRLGGGSFFSVEIFRDTLFLSIGVGFLGIVHFWSLYQSGQTVYFGAHRASAGFFCNFLYNVGVVPKKTESRGRILQSFEKTTGKKTARLIEEESF